MSPEYSKQTKERELDALFPEPVARFIVVEGEEIEVRYTNLEARKMVLQQAINIASSRRIVREIRPGGRLQPHRELTQARQAQHARIASLPYEVENILLQSDPRDPLIVTVTTACALVRKGGKELPEDESYWREFLIRKGFTHLWDHPWLGVARSFFLIRTGRIKADLYDFLAKPELKSMEQDSEFRKLLEVMNSHIRSLQPRDSRKIK